MTSIRTTCDACGEIELVPGDLWLELESNEAKGQYAFNCPYCESTERKPASERVVTILLASGVRYEVTGESTQISEAEIISFADKLDQHDWARHLEAG
jgi:hypothetical protein